MSKVYEVNVSRERALNFWPMVNVFRKLLANKNLIMDCLQNYLE